MNQASENSRASKMSLMKSIRTVSRMAVALLVLATTAKAQSLEERLEKKMAKPFIKNAAWVTDHDAARKLAGEQGKLLFAYFTRSYSP